MRGWGAGQVLETKKLCLYDTSGDRENDMCFYTSDLGLFGIPIYRKYQY